MLNCYTWFDTAATMLDYGFEHFRMEVALEAGEEATRVSVLNGDAASVGAIAARELRGAVAIGEAVETKIETDAISAPVSRGQVIGRAQLISGGQTIDECALVAAENVEVWNLAAAVRSVLRRWALRFA